MPTSTTIAAAPGTTVAVEGSVPLPTVVAEGNNTGVAPDPLATC